MKLEKEKACAHCPKKSQKNEQIPSKSKIYFNSISVAKISTCFEKCRSTFDD